MELSLVTIYLVDDAPVMVALGANSKTVISIYNLLGKKVKDVISESLSTGTYSLIVDISELSSGSYICRMESNGLKSSLPLNVVR